MRSTHWFPTVRLRERVQVPRRVALIGTLAKVRGCNMQKEEGERIGLISERGCRADGLSEALAAHQGERAKGEKKSDGTNQTHTTSCTG
jgi:hypothetical protein